MCTDGLGTLSCTVRVESKDDERLLRMLDVVTGYRWSYSAWIEQQELLLITMYHRVQNPRLP
jgi:hypothetical protein